MELDNDSSRPDGFFPKKLYKMLSDGEESGVGSEALKWNDQGDAFVIVDSTTFARTLLSKYFRSDKFSSFKRQLNTYGFKRINSYGFQRNEYVYQHHQFHRDHPELLDQIERRADTKKRKKNEAKKRKANSKKTASNSIITKICESFESPSVFTEPTADESLDEGNDGLDYNFKQLPEDTTHKSIISNKTHQSTRWDAMSLSAQKAISNQVCESFASLMNTETNAVEGEQTLKNDVKHSYIAEIGTNYNNLSTDSTNESINSNGTKDSSSSESLMSREVMDWLLADEKNSPKEGNGSTEASPNNSSFSEDMARSVNYSLSDWDVMKEEIISDHD